MGVNYMARDGNQIYGGDHFVVYSKIKLLCSTPETNKILYTNFTLKNVQIDFFQLWNFRVIIKVVSENTNHLLFLTIL